MCAARGLCVHCGNSYDGKRMGTFIYFLPSICTRLQCNEIRIVWFVLNVHYQGHVIAKRYATTNWISFVRFGDYTNRHSSGFARRNENTPDEQMCVCMKFDLESIGLLNLWFGIHSFFRRFLTQTTRTHILLIVIVNRDHSVIFIWLWIFLRCHSQSQL